MAEKTLLTVDRLGISFKGLRALDDVSFSIPEKGIIGLIGPNGAGKTTLFNLITGVYTPTDGQVLLDGEPISGKGMRATVTGGICRTFQNIRLFKDLTVLQNVKVAMHDSMHYNLFEAIFKTPRFWREEEEADQRAMELLRVFDLQDKADMRAANLPYGQQRKLEIARALATNPRLLGRSSASRSCSSSTICAWSWASVNGSSCWTTAGCWPTAPRRRSATTRRSSRPISAGQQEGKRNAEGRGTECLLR